MQPLVIFLADYLIVLIFFPVAFLLLSPSTRRVAWLALISGGLTWLISLFIKDFFYLPRPYILTQTQPLIGFLLDGTFPSSHAALAFGVSFSVWLQRRLLGLILIGVSCLIVATRVFSGVHTVIDVLSGAGLGIILTLVTHNARLLKH